MRLHCINRARLASMLLGSRRKKRMDPEYLGPWRAIQPAKHLRTCLSGCCANPNHHGHSARYWSSGRTRVEGHRPRMIRVWPFGGIVRRDHFPVSQKSALLNAAEDRIHEGLPCGVGIIDRGLWHRWNGRSREGLILDKRREEFRVWS